MYRRRPQNYRRMIPKRRGRALRRPNTGRRWEHANISLHITRTVTNNSDTCFNNFVALASVLNLADAATATGLAYVNQVRHIEIGGIVCSYGCEDVSLAEDMDLTAISQETYCRFMILSDRVNGAGVPQGISAPFQRSTTPVITLAGMTPSTDQEQDFPEQIHYQDTWRCNTSNQEFTGANAGSLYGLHGQRVNPNRQGRVNKRLRLIIDELHGLYVNFALYTGASYAVPQARSYSTFVEGYLYYRVRM